MKRSKLFLAVVSSEWVKMSKKYEVWKAMSGVVLGCLLVVVVLLVLRLLLFVLSVTFMALYVMNVPVVHITLNDGQYILWVHKLIE